jgi:tetratricopeptide (TPR) repeat protein
MGEHRESRLAAQTALELAKKINDLMTMVRAYSILSLACIFLGDYLTARESIQEGEKLARERGLKTELAMILSTHAQMIFFTEKDAIKSKYYLDESARLAQEAGYRWASSLSIFGLARVAAMLGDFDMARAKFRESAEIARRMGNKRIIYSSQSEFAHILREHGEIDEALGIYRDLLPKWKDLGHRAAVAHELECIAYILMRKEEPERAATLLGAAEALREAIDSMMTRVEQVEYAKEMATLRAGMDVMEMQRSWSKGHSMTMDEAIGIALQG